MSASLQPLSARRPASEEVSDLYPPNLKTLVMPQTLVIGAPAARTKVGSNPISRHLANLALYPMRTLRSVYRRQELQSRKVLSARGASPLPGWWVREGGGCVIARRRSGAANGFIFISMEDETVSRQSS